MPELNINGRFLGQALTGVQRHALEVVRALDSIIANDDHNHWNVKILAPHLTTSSISDLSAIEIKKIGKYSGHLWEQFDLPRLNKGLLLNLCNTYPLLAKNQIVTVHDASTYAVPEGYTPAFRLFYRFLHKALKNRADVPVLTDSKFSASELRHHIGLPPERIHVVHCGCDHWKDVTPDLAVLARLGLSSKSYVLAVASENPNKNLTRLKAAFPLVESKGKCLVLVGGGNVRVFQSEGDDDPPWLLRAGRVTDAELAMLYEEAACFVFPSLYEGFGLPPLEAMRFGCPVVCSRAASLPEVCGDAAHYCDVMSEVDIARAISEVLNDSALRTRLIAAGKRQIEQFRWQRTALQILEVANRYLR